MAIRRPKGINHPKRIGSYWVSGNYIHGPRQKKPGEFLNIFIKPQSWARTHKLHIIPKLPKQSKVKVGFTKKRRLDVQSYMTPKKSYYYVPGYVRKGKFIKAHIRKKRR
jgi:hypothetical protein